MFLRLLLLIVILTAGWFPDVSHSQGVRISYSGVSGQNLPFWVTYDAGLYKKHGLNAEMLSSPAASLTSRHSSPTRLPLPISVGRHRSKRFCKAATW